MYWDWLNNNYGASVKLFDLVFSISKAMITFSQMFIQFMTTPIVMNGFDFAFLNTLSKIPGLGGIFAPFIDIVKSSTPLAILSTNAFVVIMVLIILKKVVPLL